MPKEQVTIPFFIPHEGCPFTCVFCNQHATSGSKASVDALSIREKVIRYRKTVASTIKHVEIAFFGGSFTGLSIDSQKNFLKEAYNCLQEGLVSGIRLSTRPDFISDEIIEIIKEYKVSTIELGVQSFDDSVLGASARGHTADDTKLALIKLKKSKIPFVIQLMPGLPSASFESDIKSAKQACTFKPQGVRIYPTVVVKGT